jgi:ABC-type polysaccharide transport system permease subunit
LKKELLPDSIFAFFSNFGVAISFKKVTPISKVRRYWFILKAFIKFISKPFIYENKKHNKLKIKSVRIIFFLPKVIKSNKKAIQAKQLA